MHIAILGAGFAGMAAAYDLKKADHRVTIFEKSAFPGGAAGGFKEKNWDPPSGEASWYLDYAYHHLFLSDKDMFDFCREIGWNKIITRKPVTASTYKISNDKFTNPQINNKIQMYKLDTPIDLLKFPKLSLLNRLRTGMALASLRFLPEFSAYHTMTAETWAKKFMGEESWKVLWEPLMLKKYGEKYAHDINAMFFWARINKRTPQLAYPEGGFQKFANFTAEKLQKMGVHIKFKCQITQIHKSNSKFIISSNTGCWKNSNSQHPVLFDTVINTLQSPLFLQIEKNVLPAAYRKQLSKIKYLGAQCLIYESEKPLIDDVYWLNIADMKNPWMVAVAHTNFMDKKNYGGKHITYLAKYGPKQMTNDKFTNQFQNSNAKLIKEAWIEYGQPLYTTEFHKIMPQTVTPVSGLYFANMENTYPADRGTNYAVKAGRRAAHELMTNVK